MDSEQTEREYFRERLAGMGMTSASIKIMEEEGIVSEGILKSLRREHINKLLPLMKVGQHVLLYSIWDDGPQSLSSAESISIPASSPSSSSSLMMKSPGNICTASKAESFKAPSPSPFRSPSPSEDAFGTAAKPNIKDLALAYKKKALERFQASPAGTKGIKSSAKSKKSMMMITLGGMIYNNEIQKGIRKKSLPEPNPTKVEMESVSNLLSLQEKAKELYFMDYMTPPEKLILGDSSGIPIVVASKETWTLETFYQNHGLQPSRYKMYFMLDLQEELEMKQQPAEKRSRYDDVDPVIRDCIECGHKFRTYVPGQSTRLPGGSVVFYDEPQLRCPECDQCCFGLFMNEDLFPHLAPGPVRDETNQSIEEDN